MRAVRDQACRPRRLIVGERSAEVCVPLYQQHGRFDVREYRVGVVAAGVHAFDRRRLDLGVQQRQRPCPIARGGDVLFGSDRTDRFNHFGEGFA